ncbi:MAG: ATP-grasp domain-containing protein [Mesorhizobium sp.]|nr:MAG: ATP-grasp domain-containing protein [Mesorhizobium sp.]
MAGRALILIEGGAWRCCHLYVQAAQHLGLHPVNLSANPTQHDFLAAGCEAIRVDTGNLDALIGECSRLRATHDIAGIVCAEERVYATVGKLCQYFDLPGPNPLSIERCCDKFTQRQLLAEAGIPIPAYRLAANARDVESSAAEIGLPVVLKPAVGSGSVGVRLCRNFDEVAEHTTYLLGGKHIWQCSPRILIEEFAQGPHHLAAMMGNEVIGFGTAEYGPPTQFVFRQLTFPARLTDVQHERLADVSMSCLRALGLGWGPTNIELRWTERGPVVIEVNPRLAGAPEPQLLQLAYGIHLIAEHIKLVIGDEWNLRKTHSYTAAAQSLFPDRDGTLDWIYGERQAAAVSGIAEVKFHVKPQTPIIRKGDCKDPIGYIVAASPSLAETEAILQRAADLINWSITPFPPPGEQNNLN